MTAYLTHTDASIFPHPDAFMPERWLSHGDSDSENKSKELARYVIPFSKGPMNCLGIEYVLPLLPLSLGMHASISSIYPFYPFLVPWLAVPAILFHFFFLIDALVDSHTQNSTSSPQSSTGTRLSRRSCLRRRGRMWISCLISLMGMLRKGRGV